MVFHTYRSKASIRAFKDCSTFCQFEIMSGRTNVLDPVHCVIYCNLHYDIYFDQFTLCILFVKFTFFSLLCAFFLGFVLSNFWYYMLFFVVRNNTNMWICACVCVFVLSKQILKATSDKVLELLFQLKI